MVRFSKTILLSYRLKSKYASISHIALQRRYNKILQLDIITVWTLPLSLATTEGISILITLPPGTQMFQFPGCRLIHLFYSMHDVKGLLLQVFPFGYLRIIEYLLLPVAYRSLSRPSSPSSAQASTLSPYLLDHIILFFLTLKNKIKIKFKYALNETLAKKLFLLILQ